MALFTEEQEAIAAFIAAAKSDASDAFPAADNAAAVGALRVMLGEAMERLSDADRGAMLRIMDDAAAGFRKRVQARKEAAHV